MAQYSLAFAPTGSTFVVPFDGRKLITLKSTARKTDRRVPIEDLSEELAEPKALVNDPRINFIDETLQSGDVLWTELGGPNGAFIRRAFAKGVQVFRIPTGLLSDSDLPSVEPDDSTEDDDSGQEQGTASGLEAARRDRAYQIMALARENPGAFYAMREVDGAVVRISIYARAFDFWQRRLRIKAQQQLIGINRDFAYLVDDDLGRAELRLKREFASEELLAETVRIEGMLSRLLGNSLKSSDMYEKVFASKPGVGPSIAGRVIDAVGDIRRFESPKGFQSYCGWFPGADGQIVRRRRGQTLGFSVKLKQALNLYGDQVGIYGHGSEAHLQLFAETKARELARGATKILAQRRAKRKVIGQFAKEVFLEGWLWEVTGGTMTTLFMAPQDIPEAVRWSLADHYPDLGMPRKPAEFLR